MGSNGLFHASRIGECLPSEMAHYLLFGYTPNRFPGRGLLEAVGFGVPFEDEDVLCLAHLSCVRIKEGKPILALPRKEVPWREEQLAAFFEALTSFETDDFHFRLHRTGRNDAILAIKGPASPHISDSDPIVAGHFMACVLPVSENPEPRKAAKTATALNAYLTHCHRTLTDHALNRKLAASGKPTANFLATQRSGRKISQKPFEAIWGMKGRLIASGAMYKGLAHELGLDFTTVADGPNPGEDLQKRIRMALADNTHDFCHVHTKTPDQAAHKGNPLLKRDVISSLDQGLGDLVEALKTREDLLVCVTADHSTPCESILIHSGEPVPFVVAGPRVRRDFVTVFDEVRAAQGCMGLIRGDELMRLLLNCADRSVLKGHQLGAFHGSHFSSDYESFIFRSC